MPVPYKLIFTAAFTIDSLKMSRKESGQMCSRLIVQKKSTPEVNIPAGGGGVSSSCPQSLKCYEQLETAYVGEKSDLIKIVCDETLLICAKMFDQKASAVKVTSAHYTAQRSRSEVDLRSLRIEKRR